MPCTCRNDSRTQTEINEVNEFVIRLHHAERAGTHHDLHLDGESWAVPKLVPTETGVKVLAIKTAYHAPEQTHFEGTIPKGQYGAGTCEVIDEGVYELISSSPHLRHFQLRGDTYIGEYYLRLWKGNNWLLWKS